eukprot:9088592-Pyramimonas_sp.AAC.1
MRSKKKYPNRVVNEKPKTPEKLETTLTQATETESGRSSEKTNRPGPSGLPARRNVAQGA